jgi:DNA-binding NarL/FixJ family response regulator
LLIAGPDLQEAPAFHQLLAQQAAISVVGHAADAKLIPGMAARLSADVVLLQTKNAPTAEAMIRDVVGHMPCGKLLVMAPSLSLDDATLLLGLGACGVMTARDLHPQGIRAIRAVHAGEIWGSRAVLSRIAQRSIRHATNGITLPQTLPGLTERESEIVKLLRSGASNKEIAAQLRISDKTVKSHLQNIFGKLNIHRRQQIHPGLSS